MQAAPGIDILDFEAELHDKQMGVWGNRIEPSEQVPVGVGGVTDEVEWLVNEYSKARKFHNLKASPAFFEAYVDTRTGVR